MLAVQSKEQAEEWLKVSLTTTKDCCSSANPSLSVARIFYTCYLFVDLFIYNTQDMLSNHAVAAFWR